MNHTLLGALMVAAGVIFRPGFVLAQEAVEYRATVTSTADNTRAAQTAVLQAAQEQAVGQYGPQILGRALSGDLSKKILSQSARFITSSKIGELRARPEGGYEAEVVLKVSPRELRAVMQKLGVLDIKGESSGLVFPAVVFRREGQAFKWWETPAGAGPLFSELVSRFHAATRARLLPAGFFLMAPSPGNSLLARPRLDTSAGLILDTVKPDLALLGEIAVGQESPAGAARIQIQVRAFNLATRRTVAEVVRDLPVTDLRQALLREQNLFDEPLGELAQQLSEGESRGTISTVPVRLVFEGRISPKKIQTLKSSVGQIPQVKLVRERSFTSSGFDLEAEVPEVGVDISGALARLQVSGLAIRVLQSSPSLIRLSVQSAP